MQKLLVAALSVLSVGLVTATPEQSQAQMAKWSIYGQQSGSSVKTGTRSNIINGVAQPKRNMQGSFTRSPITCPEGYILITFADGYQQRYGCLPNIKLVRNTRRR